MTASPQWVRFYSVRGAYDAEVVHAHYVEHRFARHAHEHFVIGLVQKGTQQYTYRHTRHTTPAGYLFFVNGDEPHTGEPATTEGYIAFAAILDLLPGSTAAADKPGRSSRNAKPTMRKITQDLLGYPARSWDVRRFQKWLK